MQKVMKTSKLKLHVTDEWGLGGTLGIDLIVFASTNTSQC